MKIGTRVLLRFWERFDANPFIESIYRKASLALGEAYTDGELEIEGDLYEALEYFLGQMRKFSTDTNALSNLIFTATNKKNQQKEVRSHYDLGNDFYRLWLGFPVE